MGSIRIEGDPARDLPRESYDLRRRAVNDPHAVCHAPFGSLHLRAGDARGREAAFTPCRHSRAPLGAAGYETVAEVFDGDAARALRERFRDYRVRRDECGACVELWEDGAAEESPAVAEFDRALPPVNGVPARLVTVSVQCSARLPDARVDELCALLPTLARIDLLTADATPGALGQRLLAAIGALAKEQRPRVRLFADDAIPEARGLPASIAECELRLPLVAGGLGAERKLALAELVTCFAERGATVAVRVAVGRSNWCELKPWLADLLACGALPVVEPAPREDADSLAALDGDLLAAFHGVFYRWAVELGVAHDEAKGATPFRNFLNRLRTWQRLAAERNECERFAEPGLDHALFADEGEARRLLQDLLRVYHHRRLEPWLARIAHDPAFLRGARERCALRLLALWLGCVFERSDARPALRAIYEDAATAKRLVAADRATLAGSPIAPWHDTWVRALALEVAPRAAAPFTLPPKPPRVRRGRAELTVIIPSYNHERYVGQAIDSALAQSGVRLRVLVVDDASRDGTVAAARSRSDPRVTVRVNRRNLGLGETLARTLKQVRTPYVAVLNSDDVFHPRRLEKCLAALKQRPMAAVAATRLVPVDSDGRRCGTADTSPIFDGKRVHDWLRWWESSCAGGSTDAKALLGRLFQGNFLVTSSNLVCRRDFMVRELRRWRDLEYCVDWQLFLAAAVQQKLRVVDEPLLAYRLHASNTVWFDEEREWRYYVESHRVVARALERRLAADRRAGPARFAGLLELVAGDVATNPDLDWAGVYLGLTLERLHLPSRSIRGEAGKRWIQTLDSLRRMRLHVRDVVHLLGDNLSEVLRMRGERPWLQAARNLQEAAQDELERTRHALEAAVQERHDVEKLWHSAEADRDREIADKAKLYQRIGELEGELDRAQREGTTRLFEVETERRALEQQRDQLRQHVLHQVDALKREHDDVRTALQHALGAISGERAQARAELQDALQLVRTGHDSVRDELLGALARIRTERERVEGGLVASATAGHLAPLRAEAESAALRLEQLQAELAAERARAAAELDAERSEGLRRLESERRRLIDLLNDERARLDAALLAERAARDRDVAKAGAALTEVARTHAAAVEELRAQHLGEIERLRGEVERARRAEGDLAALRELVNQRTRERDELRRTPEFRVGNLVVNKLKLKTPLRAVEKRAHKAKIVLANARLRAERRGWLGGGNKGRPRVFATVCWNFPIYSQTFVYQELLQLTRQGFDLRLIYSKLDPREHLHQQFAPLWDLKRTMHLDRVVHERDFMLYKARFPDRVEALTQRLVAASGLPRERLESHDNFLQGFTYARLAESFGADYLHSYFFYDRSLMSLIAGQVLDLPHGVSCYADHLLADYELKVVPLHLELASIVIATSHRIKGELLGLAPGIDADKILVKPNAIDCTRFPVLPRPEPAPGQPFRLVVTSRIEPKKGLIYLVDAVKLLRDEGLDVECHVIGDADHGVPASENYKAELCERIARADLWGKFHLEGRQNEQGVRRFLAMGHLFVAPFVETESGDKDGIPTALVEAIATGIPCVVTDSGSMLEVVTDGVEARVVRQRDPRGLADAIRAVLQDPKGRRFMGFKAAQRAREQFDVSVCDPRFHERIRAVLAARKR